MNLTRLALRPDDRWTRKSAVAHGTGRWSRAPGVHLEAEDVERVDAMIEACQFTNAVIMPNFDARLKTGMPPTGYSATWHRDSTFVADAFDRNMFRGAAGLSIKRMRPPDERVTAAFADLNALLGDGSPVPLVSRAQKDGGWVCSLGEFAWVGIYHQNALKFPYAVVVVAGLDPASWAACSKELREWHRTKTVDEVWPRLEFWREAAKKNRQRIAATFIRVLNETPKDANVDVTASYESRAKTKIDDGLRWFKGAHIRVPTWFVYPSKSPRGCDPLPAEPGVGVATDHSRTEGSPWYAVVEFDVVMDDLIPYGECEYVRLAGCCDSKAKFRIVVRGPQDEIFLIETPGEADPDTLNAFPAQAIQRFSQPSVESSNDSSSADGIICTWEDPALTTNRLVDAAFIFHTAVRVDEPAQRFTPHCVRVSCRDSTGRAENGAIKNRLASLAVDEWEPIQR